MWFLATVILSVCLWSTVEGSYATNAPAPPLTCRYADLCEQRVQILGREIVYDVPCLQDEVCTEFYGEWSDCTRNCGGGTRVRFGRCCSAKCTRVISETEDCNTSTCALGSTWS